MKYCFCTLAVGDTYEQSALTFHRALKEQTTNCDFFITTLNPGLKDYEEDRIHIKAFTLPNTVEAGYHLGFKFNMKCLALKQVLTYEKLQLEQNPDYQKYDFVFYVDSDWILHEEFSEEKIYALFEQMNVDDLDFVFERPARIGDGRANPEEAFFRNKLYDYDILDYAGYDEAHVANEQILLFKNNSKFKFFVTRWEQFMWYSIMNGISNYAEGFEIGISALEAKMKYDWYAFRRLTNCFAFYTNTLLYNERF